MPGSSLWLIPPKDSPLYHAIDHLINKDIPSHFPQTPTPPPHFYPHITLTSDISPPPTASPQQWLDTLPLPPTNNHTDDYILRITILELEIGDIFFKKVTLRCEKTPALAELAASCRAAAVGVEHDKAKAWAQDKYAPHLSLM